MFGVLRREKLVQLGFTPSKTVRLEFDQLCLLQKLHFIARTSPPVDTLVITYGSPSQSRTVFMLARVRLQSR